jgi:hypothetical protein
MMIVTNLIFNYLIKKIVWSSFIHCFVCFLHGLLCFENLSDTYIEDDTKFVHS